MKPINRLKGKEEGRRKKKTLINEQVSQSHKKRRNWVAELDGCRVGTEVDEEQGREGRAKQQGIVLVHQALGDTLKHIHSFTHLHGRAHKRMLLPTATQTCAGISEGSPISSPVLGVEADRPSSVKLTSEIEPPLLCSLPVDRTEYLRAVIHNFWDPNPPHKQRTSNNNL